MSLYVYVEGQRKDVERFYKDIIYPDFGRLRKDDRFRVTENTQKYYVRNQKTLAVERKIRGYSPTIRYKNRPGLWEQYFVDPESVESKKVGEDLEKIKGVQVKIHLRSDDPSEIKLFFVEFIETKRDLFWIEKDTGLYLNRRGYSSRFFGGHFIITD